ncbi:MULTISPECIES: hypothetical protein [unclassified Caballeronia]|uniref:hypothetical protein n=1 Tax=unclassified Caballeronia TaxID=2646786 RepID=UPI00202799A4|nr:MULTISPECIES: hypothetical protein [unclassified Caballeronia]
MPEMNRSGGGGASVLCRRRASVRANEGSAANGLSKWLDLRGAKLDELRLASSDNRLF